MCLSAAVKQALKVAMCVVALLLRRALLGQGRDGRVFHGVSAPFQGSVGTSGYRSFLSAQGVRICGATLLGRSWTKQ